MKRSKRILSTIIILSIFLITACGSKETDASSTAPSEESTQPADIIMESQQTRQELAESIAAANSLLSTESESEEATESSESSSQYVGDAPASYKPRGQMVTQKYRSYSKHYVTTVTPTLDSVTTKEPTAVITSNPVSGQTQDNSSSSSKATETITVPIADSDGATISLPSDTMVWLAEHGEKFHNQNKCGNMNPDKATQVTLAEAKTKISGIEACKNCYGE